MNTSVPTEWKVIVSLFTNKMLSLVVNITVHSISITWCNYTVKVTVNQLWLPEYYCKTYGSNILGFTALTWIYS